MNRDFENDKYHHKTPFYSSTPDEIKEKKRNKLAIKGYRKKNLY